MSTEAIISLVTGIATIGAMYGMIKMTQANQKERLDSQDKMLEKISNKLDQKASKSDHAELKNEVSKIRDAAIKAGFSRKSFTNEDQ